MNVSLSQMAVLDAVARNRSFSGAARDLHIGQPMVSRTVALVERMVNATLFTRTTRTVELTDAGRAYLAIARSVLAAADRAHRQWDGYQAGENGEVAVAVLPSVAATVLPAAVREFTRGRPGRSVTVFDVPADEGMDMLKAGHVDLAMCEARQTHLAPDFADIQLLTTDTLVAVTPPDSPLAALDEITWAQLAQHPFVALLPGSSVRALTDFGFDAASTSPRALVTARGVPTVAGLVAADIGVSAVPTGVLPLLGSQALAVRPLTDPVVTRRIHLLERTPPSPAAHAFRKALTDAYALRTAKGSAP
ncbi:LysR family transcriptional regulator [Streptomyces sp. CG1]|uniref:LysR family transcriptional regulator n=1 Tax=Streptomyces sp. CG1 TaxID=1287523 RepID=UPI0034E25CF7